jgi:hypothetical protein
MSCDSNTSLGKQLSSNIYYKECEMRIGSEILRGRSYPITHGPI